MNKPEQFRFADAYPDLNRGPVPVEPYISAAYFEKEREAIFRRHWMNVCRIDDVPNPGDYIVKDIAILKTSLLIVHGSDGTVRAFHNVCQHRGNQLVGDHTKGCSKFFSCGFHGWVYDAEGKLVNVPDAEEFYDLSKDPWEFNNRINDPELVAVRDDLRKKLAAWQKQTDDRIVDPDVLQRLTAEHDAISASHYAESAWGSSRDFDWAYAEYLQG